MRFSSVCTSHWVCLIYLRLFCIKFFWGFKWFISSISKLSAGSCLFKTQWKWILQVTAIVMPSVSNTFRYGIITLQRLYTCTLKNYHRYIEINSPDFVKLVHSFCNRVEPVWVNRHTPGQTRSIVFETGGGRLIQKILWQAKKGKLRKPWKS